MCISHYSTFCCKEEPRVGSTNKAVNCFITEGVKQLMVVHSLCIFCVFFVHCCFYSCLSHYSSDHSPDSAFIWVHMRLWCRPVVLSSALWEYCDSSAWPQLSFRPQPKLTAEGGSWGCCRSVSWVSDGILIQAAVLEPAESWAVWKPSSPLAANKTRLSLECSLLCGGLVDVGFTHTALWRNHNRNLWFLQIPRVDLHLNSDSFQM